MGPGELSRRKNVVIAFYLMAFTGAERRSWAAFRDAYEEFQKANTEVLVSHRPLARSGRLRQKPQAYPSHAQRLAPERVIKAYDVWNRTLHRSAHDLRHRQGGDHPRRHREPRT